MDLDRIKEETRKMKAPAAAESRSLDDLISVLKREDEKERKRYRRTMMLMVPLTAIYLGIFILTWILPPDDSPELSRLVIGLAVVIFFAVALFSRNRERKLAGIDYAGPMREFLEEAEKRYRLFNKQDLRYLLPYLLLVTIMGAVALRNAFNRYIHALDPLYGIFLFAVVFIVASGVGAVVGRSYWEKKRAPILTEIRKIRSALGSEENGKT